MTAATALTVVPADLRTSIAHEGLTLVAVEPPRSNGAFSLYFAAANPYRVLHCSFEQFIFRRASWCGASVPAADLSAIAFSFALRAGKTPHLARLEAEDALSKAGIPFLFAMIQ